MIEIEGRPIPSEFQPLGGVAVVAQNTWAAIKGREALVVEWDAGVNGGYDSVAYRKQLEEAARKPGKVVRDSGDAAALFAKGGDIVEAEYYLPHLAQAPMEPPVSTAWYKDGACEVWAPTQAPQVTRERIAERLKLPFDKVTVNVTLLGGGFGRKSKPDFVLEAAILAKAFPGRHLRVQWTREDDLHFSISTRSRWSACRPCLAPTGCRRPGCIARWRRASPHCSARTASTRAPSNWAWA